MVVDVSLLHHGVGGVARLDVAVHVEFLARVLLTRRQSLTYDENIMRTFEGAGMLSAGEKEEVARLMAALSEQGRNGFLNDLRRRVREVSPDSGRDRHQKAAQEAQ